MSSNSLSRITKKRLSCDGRTNLPASNSYRVGYGRINKLSNKLINTKQTIFGISCWLCLKAEYAYRGYFSHSMSNARVFATGVALASEAS